MVKPFSLAKKSGLHPEHNSELLKNCKLKNDVVGFDFKKNHTWYRVENGFKRLI